MTKRPSTAARALAATAVLCGFIALIVVISTSFGGDDGDGRAGRAPAAKAQGKGGKRPAAYVVQNGDTLISIARRTGVSVSRIETLNPGVDPQILVSGERLKLR